jgi:two-component system OmpR family response regulator
MSLIAYAPVLGNTSLIDQATSDQPNSEPAPVMADAERIPRVLVVDDEPNIRELVQVALKFHGCAVTTAANGAEAIRQAEAGAPDLIVLDVMLPDIDGFEVCRRLRAAGNEVPVIFLTARDTSSDTVTGLAIGGDDYVTKPFSVEALVARVRAVLRRASRSGQPGPRGDEDGMIRVGDLELDESRWTVRRAGTPVELSPTEFRLLAYLMRHQGRVLTRAQLLENVWGWDYAGESQIVETYVSYLRRKLDPLGPPLIHTQRGVGYSLRLPEHAAAHRAHQASQTWQPDPPAAEPGGG